MIPVPCITDSRKDACAIWQTGVDAVRADRLLQKYVRCDNHFLTFGDWKIDIQSVGRIAVVGGGKACVGMVLKLEEILGATVLSEKEVSGWVNVPDDCVTDTQSIHLHAARPANINEPTEEGIFGTENILKLVSSLDQNDLCICLLSGGGSALLSAPKDGVSPDDLLRITRKMNATGATIQELNIERTKLSRIKGGGLARACTAGRLVSLIISDVMDDDLSVIASGPTVASEFLCHGERSRTMAQGVKSIHNILIGNNAVALNSAKAKAKALGYSVEIESVLHDERAEECGRRIIRKARAMKQGKKCFLSGGEPTVTLVPETQRGMGGRNQQLVLAGAMELRADDDIVLLSGGTDGRDGPTDAAGAFVDALLMQEAKRRDLDPLVFLRKNDAYHFFDPLDALIKTGPTQTNVCDVRVVVRG